MLDLCVKCHSLIKFYARKITKSNSMQENVEKNSL